MLSGRNYAYVNFDDERLLNLRSDDLNSVLGTILEIYDSPNYLLFDEIQNVDGWELFINRLYRIGYNVILTGSNSKMLSKELASHLMGRLISMELFPFSFHEFLKLKKFKYIFGNENSTVKSAQIKKLFDEYLLNRGFPEVYQLESWNQYLRELYDRTIYRDIVSRYEVRYVKDLKEISLLMLNYFGSKITYQNISKLFDIKSAHTVKTYLGYLEETYLLQLIKPFSYKHKEQLKQARKVYCIDTGMINALSTQFSENRGKLPENLICIEELRHGAELYYYSKLNYELDFVIRKGGKFERFVQVSDDVSSISTLNREIRGFNYASKELDCKNLFLITQDNEELIKSNGIEIKVLPAWKYLLLRGR